MVKVKWHAEIRKKINIFYIKNDNPYHIHIYLDSEPSTFLLVNRYIIFNKFVKHIQLHMIMIYTGALPGKRATGVT